MTAFIVGSILVMLATFADVWTTDYALHGPGKGEFEEKNSLMVKLVGNRAILWTFFPGLSIALLWYLGANEIEGTNLLLSMLGIGATHGGAAIWNTKQLFF